jgi:hypothetical protein
VKVEESHSIKEIARAILDLNVSVLELYVDHGRRCLEPSTSAVMLNKGDTYEFGRRLTRYLTLVCSNASHPMESYSIKEAAKLLLIT